MNQKGTAVAKNARLPPGLAMVLAAVSGVLFWLAFFPANLGWLGWVALTPWLLSLNGRSTRHRFIASAIFGLVFYTLALNWMRFADVRMIATWIMLTVWCTLFALWTGVWSGWLVDRFPRLGWTFAFPLVCVPVEWLRSLALEGFPWYFLGHTQHEWNTLSQICDLFGVYGLSFLVAFGNGLGADIVLGVQSKVPHPRWDLLIKVAIFLVDLVGAVIYGASRLQPLEFEPHSTIAILQASHPQSVRNDGTSRDILNDYMGLSQGSMRAGRPLLLIWPETSYPSLLDMTGVESNWQPGSEAPNRPSQLLGASVEVMGPGKTLNLFNSSVLFDPTGSVPIARYDKIHRVPFGEYVPFKEWIPFMNWLAPYEHDYSIQSGTQLTRFPLPYGPDRFTFGAAICYESGDAPLFRQLAGADGKTPVDFFVNQSNDGWFHGTEEHEQHFLLLRFRAIETRKPVIRAVNMGISGWIDAYGRVLEPEPVAGEGPEVFLIGQRFLPAERWHEFKKRAFAIVGNVPKSGPATVYTALGDWLPPVLGFVGLALLVVWPIRRTGANQQD